MNLPDSVLVAEDEPTPVRGEAFLPYEQSADARIDRADILVAARPFLPGTVIRGRHLKRVERRGEFACFIKNTTAAGVNESVEERADRLARQLAGFGAKDEMIRFVTGLLVRAQREALQGGTGGGGEAYADRDAIEDACVAMGIRLAR